MAEWPRVLEFAGAWVRSNSFSIERRDEIVRRIKDSDWYRESAEAGDLDELVLVTEDLAAAESYEEFVEYLPLFYDLADRDRVWISTLGVVTA